MACKVRFTLRAEPSPADLTKKTTVPRMYSLQFLDEETVYVFSEEHKDLSHHERLMALPTAIMAKRELAPRWAKRSFKITLPDDIAALYIDSDGNPVFLGKMLDELDLSAYSTTSSGSTNLQPFTPNTTEAKFNPAPRSLSSIVKDAVIPKFGSKVSSSNAEAWLQIFEGECARLDIDQTRYWEVIRLFLEESAEKWYLTTRLSSNSTAWEFWRSSFVDNFGQQGIAVARTAFSYKFIGGPMNNYVQNKLNLLASFNPRMHELDKMAHLILGLPNRLQERVNLAECNSLSKLLSTLNAFDCPSRTILPNTLNASPSSTSAFSSLKPRTPCPYCKKKGFERMHFEKDCLVKARDLRQLKPNVNIQKETKAIHSFDLTDLENEISNIQKNE